MTHDHDETMAATIRRGVPSCGVCADGWVCEHHPTEPYPCRCGAPGVPCREPGCPFSLGADLPAVEACRLVREQV